MNLSFLIFTAIISKLLKAIFETSHGEEDFFSRLPEDVVDRIVSFMPLKDAAAMSPVSKSWRHRWNRCPNLDFDLHPEEETSAGRMCNLRQRGYANWVNSVLASHQGNTIKLFRIRSACCANVDKWIMFALQKQAPTLIITDVPRYEDERGQLLRNYALPRWFSLTNAPFLKHLTLGNICLGPFEVTCLNHLKSLTLDNVFISETWLLDMFRNCIHLRRLSLLRCTSLSISKLVVPRHLQLQHLCLFSGLRYVRKVEMEGGQNLESLECSSDMIKCFSFQKLPNLRKLSLLVDTLEDDLVTRLGLGLPSLQHFHLGVDAVSSSWQKNLTTFGQLRFLSLSGLQLQASLTKYVGFLLRMSPILHTLELRGSFKSAQNAQQMTKRCFEPEPHQTLKVVRIYGFEHCQAAVDLVVYLLENSVNLESVQINRRRQAYMGEDIWADDDKQELKSSPEGICEWFRTRVSSCAKLVVL